MSEMPGEGAPFDAVLVVSFGGPEGPDEVLPFLGNVLAGRDVPHERMLAVAEHYYAVDGVSPINGQNRDLVVALQAELAAHGPHLPVYWGNRNWAPYLTDVVATMRDDGIRRAAAFVTSAYSSYSGCRQYREDMGRARAGVEGAPELVKLRPFFNHPGFIEACADRLAVARADAGADAPVLFTAHSIPVSMAERCDYGMQLRETARLVAERSGPNPVDWRLVFQSRSGPPSQPWLEPDVLDAVQALPAGTPSVVVCPIGFVSDHMEVVHDLDQEAAEAAGARGLRLVRAGTAGTHPAFVGMIVDLVDEAAHPARPRLALGSLGPRRELCLTDCCPPPARRPAPAAGGVAR